MRPLFICVVLVNEIAGKIRPNQLEDGDINFRDDVRRSDFKKDEFVYIQPELVNPDSNAFIAKQKFKLNKISVNKRVSKTIGLTTRNGEPRHSRKQTQSRPNLLSNSEILSISKTEPFIPPVIKPEDIEEHKLHDYIPEA